MYDKCACCGHAIKRRVDLCVTCQKEEQYGTVCGRDLCAPPCDVSGHAPKSLAPMARQLYVSLFGE